MCRMRVSLFSAKQAAIMGRNFLWHEKPLDQAQITLLVNALEDMVSDLETARRRRIHRRWGRAWRVGTTRRRRRPAESELRAALADAIETIESEFGSDGWLSGHTEDDDNVPGRYLKAQRLLDKERGP